MTKRDAEYKKITPKDMRKAATGIIDYLAKQGLWSDDVTIYAGRCRFAPSERESAAYGLANTSECRTRYHIRYFMTKGVDPRNYIESADPKTIAITFEGPLHTRINFSDDGPDFVYGLSEKFLAEYGLYFEQENGYTLVAYRI